MRMMSPLHLTRSIRVLITVAIVLLAIFASVQLFNYSFRVQSSFDKCCH